MLTCKVGESIVNCIDCTYDRYQLKMWSNKGILKCPVCNRDYEYCHGEVVPPYFRHKDKECSGYYTEPETEEHKKGKTLLYEWIKNQPGIENLQLEAWIPETKQRPDIYFEQNGKRYVIEYQCTPIASEYIKRRELYKLNNINDIWVLGTEKYKLFDINDELFIHDNRYKVIEKSNDKDETLLYLNSTESYFISNNKFFPIKFYENMSFLYNNGFLENRNTDHKINILKFSNAQNDYFLKFNADDFTFNESIHYKKDIDKEISNAYLYISQEYSTYLKELKGKQDFRNKLYKLKLNLKENKIKRTIKEIKKELNTENLDMGIFKFNRRYDFSVIYKDVYYFFIKKSSVDFCIKKGNRYEHIETILIYDIYDTDIKNFIVSKLKSHVKEALEEKQKEMIKFKKTNRDLINLNIKIIDNSYVLPNDIRFRYLKDVDNFDYYYVKFFLVNELRKLKKSKEIVLMVNSKKLDINTVIKNLRDYGFTNINMFKSCVKKGETK